MGLFAEVFKWIYKQERKKKRVFSDIHKKRISEGLQLYHQRRKIAIIEADNPFVMPEHSKILEHGERTMDCDCKECR